jgi:hypothetical protein
VISDLFPENGTPEDRVREWLELLRPFSRLV